MTYTKHIVIVAGEESGDLHAASFVHELKARHPDLKMTGIGGQHMQAAGVHLISDLARHGVTGLTEVLRHVRVLRRAYNAMKAHLIAHQPDLLILVDYPGFNLRLAQFAKKKLGIRILYYVSPQIWAWKAQRIHTIRACVDHMAVILPFEKPLYEQAGVPVSFVGHPLLHNKTYDHDKLAARERLGLPSNKRIIAMLPGSRLHEIEKHMPILQQTTHRLCKELNDLHVVIPVASTINPALIKAYFTNASIPYTLTSNAVIDTIASSDCVVVASGTASLECALLEKPMCIIYKASLLTYLAASQLMKVKYLGLCNLLQNKMIVPELLQNDCNPTELTRLLMNLLTDHAMSQGMRERLHQLKRSLSIEQADRTISQLIEIEAKLMTV